MATAEETQAAAAALAAANPYVQPPPQAQPQQTPAPAPAQPQPQGHPDMARPPATQGEPRPVDHRGPGIWIPPDEWTQSQAELRTLKEWKKQNDELLEMKENERLRLMAEKGQIEQAFTEMKAINDRKQQELQAKLEQRERVWLEKERTQVINEVMAGRNFLGKDEEARMRTANMVRKLLELEIEAIINPATGEPNVRDRKTLRPAIEYLKERLTAPDSEFAALLAPNKPSGGSGTDGTRPPATPNTPPPVAMSPDETVKAWQAMKQPITAVGLSPILRQA